MTGYFIEGSTATGVLIAILTTADINFNSITREQDQLHLEGTISNVGGGDHNVSMFVMEEDGLPFSRTATIPQVVSVVDSKQLTQLMTCYRTCKHLSKPFHL